MRIESPLFSGTSRAPVAPGVPVAPRPSGPAPVGQPGGPGAPAGPSQWLHFARRPSLPRAPRSRPYQLLRDPVVLFSRGADFALTPAGLTSHAWRPGCTNSPLLPGTPYLGPWARGPLTRSSLLLAPRCGGYRRRSVAAAGG
jgi:hypothetical protein